MKNDFFILGGICMVLVYSTVCAQGPENKLTDTPRLVPYNYQSKETVNLYGYYPEPLNLQASAGTMSNSGKGASAGYYTMQFLMAELVGCLGIASGFMTGAVINKETGMGDLDFVITAMYFEYAMGIALGVHGVGKYKGRNGSYWRAMTGSTIGVILSILICEQEDNNDHPVMGVTSTFLLPQLSSMLCYNIKMKPRYPSKFSYSPKISIGQLGNYQDVCGGLGVKMDLLSYRF